jgi:hypothetical protein
VSVVALASAAGSPGVTTLGMGWITAAAADDAEWLLVEADPAGGAAAAYGGLRWDLGLVSLAAGTWGDIDGAVLGAHAQRLADGAAAVVGPANGQEATSALTALGRRLVDGVGRAGNVVVDVGRLWPSSPALELARAADLVVVVVAQMAGSQFGTGAAVAKARGLLGWLSSEAMATAAVVIGEEPYGRDELAAVLEARVLGVVPHDRRAALAVGAGGGRRSGLARWYRSVAAGAEVLLGAPAPQGRAAGPDPRWGWSVPPAAGALG